MTPTRYSGIVHRLRCPDSIGVPGRSETLQKAEDRAIKNEKMAAQTIPFK